MEYWIHHIGCYNRMSLEFKNADIARVVAKAWVDAKYPKNLLDIQPILCYVIERMIQPKGSKTYSDIEMEGWVKKFLDEKDINMRVIKQ